MPILKSKVTVSASLFLLLVLVLQGFNLISAGRNPDPGSLSGKVLFGYQGWFDTPSVGTGWVHWSAGVSPSADTCSFDLWPDISEFDAVQIDNNTELHDRKNGKAMGLYASTMVQDIHFSWMRDYDIDGVLVQRFLSELSNPDLKLKRDTILLNALSAAEKYGRVVGVMYDISGCTAEDWAENLLQDWDYLANELMIPSYTSYQHHEGRPLLAVWGIGFNDREASAEDSFTLINSLKDSNGYNCFFMGGVPTHWRTGDGDSLPGFDKVYAAMDVLSPWLVGRYSNDAEFDLLLTNTIWEDSLLCGLRDQGYAPNVWPGFSWYNLQKGDDPLNQIPRNAGAFWQYQFDAFTGLTSSSSSSSSAALTTGAFNKSQDVESFTNTSITSDTASDTTGKIISAVTAAGNFGASGGSVRGHQSYSAFRDHGTKLPYPPLFVYGAMFDEFDEGTAMAKAACCEEELPVEGSFLHLSIDGVDLERDYYLQLAGNNTLRYRDMLTLQQQQQQQREYELEEAKKVEGQGKTPPATAVVAITTSNVAEKSAPAVPHQHHHHLEGADWGSEAEAALAAGKKRAALWSDRQRDSKIKRIENRRNF